jgi:hypothetical protein
VAGSELNLEDKPLVERRQIDCVEIYLPKDIKFLSEVYAFLREKVENRLGPIVLDGFSIYEVDGVFRGVQFWQQRTLVIRLLLIRPIGSPEAWVYSPINILGRDIARVAASEETIWVCHYPQTLTAFAGLRHVLP